MVPRKSGKGSSSNNQGSSTVENVDPVQLSDHIQDRDDEDIRVYAAITFAFLLIFVGLPLWWKTTEVYRVHVPYGRIDDLREMDINFPVTITIVSKSNDRSSSIRKYLSNSTILTTNGLLNINFHEDNTFDQNEFLSCPSLLDLDDKNLFPNEPGLIFLVEVPDMHRFSINDAVVGGKRVIYFSQQASEELLESVLNLWIVQPKQLHHTRAILESPNEFESDNVRRRRMPPAAQYELMFSIVHPEPEKRAIVWNVQKAIEDHMGNLISALSSLATLRIKSQWLYLVRLEGRPRQVQNEKEVWYSLPEDVLPHIITPLEKKLGSGVGEHPTIQLVLYISPCQMSPLLITSNKAELPPSTGFLSPRWGAIQIYNPPPQSCGNLESGQFHSPNSSLIMSSFKKHLKLLIGVPELIKIDHVEQLPLPISGVRDWELDSLMRLRALEHLISARMTLKSLAQLLDEISNIVITDEVGARIWDAITKSHDSSSLILNGDLKGGFQASKEAFLAAETAFSDPSLLTLLYFPDDQKYAVYIPLFLPIMIPVLMSFKGIKTWWVTGTTKIAEKVKAD